MKSVGTRDGGDFVGQSAWVLRFLGFIGGE